MAKRKRLSPAMLTPDAPATPVKSSRPPIADVSGDAAATSALMELSDKVSAARKEGRWIEQLPLDAIKTDYLVRDRVQTDADEMDALKDSLRAGGQQTAIEVVPYGENTYGLISGWRRLTALRELCLEGGIDSVLAIVRHPDDAAAAYLAMVEENEIRSDLSFYERGRIVARAVDEGAYPSDKLALKALFHAVPRAKKSKIGSFVRIVRALDDVLQFPTDLSEHKGLALASALSADTGLAARLRKKLESNHAKNGAEEIALIDAVLKPKGKTTAPAKPEKITMPSGVDCYVHDTGKVVIKGDKLQDMGYLNRLMQAVAAVE